MRYIAVHAHFYQPPRENPWLDAVEIQPGAAPFHDWNERIANECYGPNTAARILDDEGRIRSISNNFARLSFNVGPTLANWLAGHALETLRGMVAGDRESLSTLGRGGALAQPYAHPILPLCTHREKRLQVLWGLHDFEHRFGRKADGLWLPETAVDLETLEVLADLSVRFTLLAPHQARRRPGGGDEKPSKGPEEIDHGRAYRQELPGGRFIDLLFYHRDVSQAVAFENLLANGQGFADRIRGAAGSGKESRLVLVATDGESYGHHHRFGEMALAYALDALAEDPEIGLTTPAAFLEEHPPTETVDIVENTSWSCAHGIERWCSNCGCRIGPAREEGPEQEWREPLRRGLDGLRDRLEECYADRGRDLLVNAERAAEDYGRVVAARTETATTEFLERHLRRPRQRADRRDALCLLEMQRHALLMFTSCGWFFNVLDGIEPVQCLRHAARASELARRLGATDPEKDLVRELARAPGSTGTDPDGEAIWRRRVLPAAVSPPRAAAHHAVSRLFGRECTPLRRSFSFADDEGPGEPSGGGRLVRGRVRVRERLIGEEATYRYAVLRLDGPEVHGGVRPLLEVDAAAPPGAAAADALDRGDLQEAREAIEREFAGGLFGASALLPDLRRDILQQVTEEALARVEQSGGDLYRDDLGLLDAWRHDGRNLPRPLTGLLQFIFERHLAREARVASAGAPLTAIRGLLDRARDLGLALEGREAGQSLHDALVVRLERLSRPPERDQTEELDRILDLIEIIEDLPERPTLWEPGNRFHRAFGPSSAQKGLGQGPTQRKRILLALYLGFGRDWLEAAGAPSGLVREVRDAHEQATRGGSDG